MNRSFADVKFCQLNDSALTRTMSSFINWKHIEASKTFRKSEWAEMCHCCDGTFSITIAKDKVDANMFRIEISVSGREYTLSTRRKYGADRDIVQERCRIEAEEIEPIRVKFARAHPSPITKRRHLYADRDQICDWDVDPDFVLDVF